MQLGNAFISLVIVPLLMWAAPALASTGSRFRGAVAPSSEARGDHIIDKREVEFSLRSSLEALLDGGRGPVEAQLRRIEASLTQSYRAAPKNTVGRLAPRAVRYLVHRYFAKEHGWLISGLEPHGMQTNVTEVHEVTILQDRAPALVEALLEARQSNTGLSLDDLAVMVAALERLIFDESLRLLEASYTLNFLSAGGPVDEEELHEILRSYLLIFQIGIRGNLTDARKHQAVKRKLAKTGSSWDTLVDFEEDAVRNDGFNNQYLTNPFIPQQYSFQDASRIVEQLAQDYGKWQNAECHQMKEELVQLDGDGDGRVLLSSFYATPETASYQFTESPDYLRTIGALDETVPNAPSVLIANYMLGPSNCIASSSYYSVCCLNDCEAIMNELEGNIQAPTASPEQLLLVIANLTSSSYSSEGSWSIPEDLKNKMLAIGAQNGGVVPLHGRLFGQWLHIAFPKECPYPRMHRSSAVLTPGHWMKNESITAPKEERQRHIEVANNASLEIAQIVEEQPRAMEWSDEEVLLLEEPTQGQSTGSLRAVAMMVAVVALLRAAYTGLCTVARVARKDVDDKRTTLPLHF